MKKIFYIITIFISFFVLQIVYGEELEHDFVLGYRAASWAHDCIAVWRLPENNTEESIRYYLKLYKDNRLIDERAVDIKIDLYCYPPYIRAVYDYSGIMNENGYGIYKYSVSMDENTEGIFSDEYFHKNTEKISDYEFKILDKLSDVVYVSDNTSCLPYMIIYVNKEESKFELVDETEFFLHHSNGTGLEYDYHVGGNDQLEQRKFIPKKSGEESIEYVFCDSSDNKIKTISLKYNINENLKAEYVGYEIKTVLVGDIDNNGILTAKDVSLMLQHCFNDKFISPIDKLYGTFYSYDLYDFDGDRNLTVNDAVELLNKVLSN